MHRRDSNPGGALNKILNIFLSFFECCTTVRVGGHEHLHMCKPTTIQSKHPWPCAVLSLLSVLVEEGVRIPSVYMRFRI